jgi:hypothetical protein
MTEKPSVCEPVRLAGIICPPGARLEYYTSTSALYTLEYAGEKHTGQEVNRPV